ncbi:MAG: hypothetical protein NHG36_08735, partial [Chromatiaceae bacterium]|nr:hypothetical protein [Candidatus Thioaporhodococcus sediminis]
LAAANGRCLRAVANALIVDRGLIAFLRNLAPQWGSSTGKTRSYNGLLKLTEDEGRCILRVDSRTAILLNEALYRHQGPAPVARQMAEALRHPVISTDGQQCRITAAGLPPLIIALVQYADADGLPVAPDSTEFHHRVISIMPD